MVKFGNSDAYIINDLDIKQKIIDYIFSLIDPSKYRYNMLENVQQLNILKNNEHYVSPNFKGFNYFLVFYKFPSNSTSKDTFSQCIAIDKKNLSYHKNTIDLKKIFMCKIKVMASSSIFRGTLFDAKLIKNIMLVKDCYHIMGNNITDMDMNDKMIYLDTILANQFQSDGCINFKFKINKLYRYNMLKEIVENIIPKCELEITGLIFYSKKSGISYIYTDKKISDKIEIQSTQPTQPINNISYNMIHQIKDFLCSRVYSYENNNVPKKVLYVEPTEITDVYNVYNNNTDENKIGIAHIPNMKISFYCRENIKEKVKCMCIFYKQFNKWIPINIINN